MMLETIQLQNIGFQEIHQQLVLYPSNMIDEKVKKVHIRSIALQTFWDKADKFFEE